MIRAVKGLSAGCIVYTQDMFFPVVKATSLNLFSSQVGTLMILPPKFQLSLQEVLSSPGAVLSHDASGVGRVFSGLVFRSQLLISQAQSSFFFKYFLTQCSSSQLHVHAVVCKGSLVVPVTVPGLFHRCMCYSAFFSLFFFPSNIHVKGSYGWVEVSSL